MIPYIEKKRNDNSIYINYTRITTEKVHIETDRDGKTAKKKEAEEEIFNYYIAT